MSTPRAQLHQATSLGERAADAIAAGMGSWRFILIQTAVVLCWMAVNVTWVVLRFDPFPFILLNLLFSTQAAYASPIILMAGNRQASKDRARDDLEAREVAELLDLNRTQLQILEQQNAILALLRSLVPEPPTSPDPSA